MLAAAKGKPEQHVLESLGIRTMAKAVYTGQKTSHFGLAFAYYTHFTSPIRRYPDLLAHRILFDLLNAKPSTYNSASIEELAKHSSNMEQKASDAERASIKYKLAELMKLHEGEIFEARVTGVTEWGIYATILDYHAEGLIRLTDIRKDQFYFVEDQRKVVGRRTKREYRLGDIISVRVKKANLLARNIDLTLID
jgi:ribonuclease R